jgi:alkanesulfonate monooxygenase
VVEVARWTERAGCAGLLVYTDNALIDPWLISQLIIDGTETTVPLVAVQPAYMHPYAAARMVASISYLHGRRLDVNVVAGGSRLHLRALGDDTAHDVRYQRLVEYTTVLRELLESPRPVNFTGQFYRLRAASLPTRPEPGSLPRIFLSGSSDDAQDAAQRLGTPRLIYPLPPAEYPSPAQLPLKDGGVRLGIIARETSSEAWKVALSRFPADAMGESVHRAVSRLTDSQWHAELNRHAASVTDSEPTPFWTHPFLTYRTFCPYLVGSYAEVGQELGRYLMLGASTIILDVPAEEDDLQHARIAFSCAAAM